MVIKDKPVSHEYFKRIDFRLIRRQHTVSKLHCTCSANIMIRLSRLFFVIFKFSICIFIQSNCRLQLCFEVIQTLNLTPHTSYSSHVQYDWDNSHGHEYRSPMSVSILSLTYIRREQIKVVVDPSTSLCIPYSHHPYPVWRLFTRRFRHLLVHGGFSYHASSWS